MRVRQKVETDKIDKALNLLKKIEAARRRDNKELMSLMGGKGNEGQEGDGDDDDSKSEETD